MVGEKQIKLIEKIAHSKKADGAYIIAGPAGAGKEDFAQKFVSLLLSSEKLHNNFFEIRPEIVSKGGKVREKEISIGQIRDVLRFMNLKSLQASHMVCLIEGAERMNLEAQNALLKSLEEPKRGNVFLLITETEGKLLPTIYSRSVLIKLGLASPQRIFEFLKERGAGESVAREAAYYGWGKIKRSRELATSDKALKNLKEEEENFKKIIKAPFFEKMMIFEKESEDKRKMLKKIDTWVGFLVVSIEQKSSPDLLFGKDKPGFGFSQRKLLEILAKMVELRGKIKYSNASPRLAMEAAFLYL